MSEIKKEIFKKNEIIGNFEKGEISEETARLVGHSFAEFLSLNGYKKAVAVGKDMSPNSNSIAMGLIKGLLEKGINVTNLGGCLTPALYFAINTLEVSFGIKIMGENLSKEAKSFEILTKRGKIKEEELREIREITEAFSKTEGWEEEKRGYLSNIVGNFLYSQKIISLGKEIIENKKIENLKVIFALGKEQEGLLVKKSIEEILEKAGINYLVPSFTDNSLNPNLEVPRVLNLSNLQKKVLEEKADFGIAYGEEYQKLIIVDRMGEIFQGNTLLFLAAKEILEENPGAGVAGFTENSRNYSKTIEDFGGKALSLPENDVAVAKAIEKAEAIFGEGESGHFFFADKYFGYPDAIYSTLRFLKIFSELKKQKNL